MPPHQRTICGLDLRRDAICMAQYSAEAAAVTSVAVQPLEAVTAIEDWWKLAGAEIRRLASDGNLKGADVVCSLPFETALIKTFTLDNDEDDVAGVIGWELSQHILGNLSDYSFDFQKLSSSDPQRDRYLVVACRSESVKQLAGVIRAQKMNPVIMDLDIMGLVNAYEANYADLGLQTTALVFADANRLTVALTDNGELIDFETALCSIDADSAQECATQITAMLTRLQIVASAPAFLLDIPMYLSGPVFSAPEFTAAVVQRLPSAQPLYPFRHVPFQGGNIPEEDLRRFAPQLAVAVGLALRGGAETNP